MRQTCYVNLQARLLYSCRQVALHKYFHSQGVVCTASLINFASLGSIPIEHFGEASLRIRRFYSRFYLQSPLSFQPEVLHVAVVA